MLAEPFLNRLVQVLWANANKLDSDFSALITYREDCLRVLALHAGEHVLELGVHVALLFVQDEVAIDV